MKRKWKIQVWEEIHNFCIRLEFPEVEKHLEDKSGLNEQDFLMEIISKNLYANRCGGNWILGWAVERCVFVFGRESCRMEAPMFDM